MTKAELISKMAAGSKISKAAAGKALEAFLDGVKAALKKDERVTLVGFGTFSVSKRKARKEETPGPAKRSRSPQGKSRNLRQEKL
jgi:DNA-binding protein HU-beta